MPLLDQEINYLMHITNYETGITFREKVTKEIKSLQASIVI